MNARIRWAEQHLRYLFHDSQFLEQALTHRSASKLNNERLEFLGDAFLNFSIARCLYEARGEDNEGDLSRLRAELVKGETLADIARELNLDKRVILGPGELRSGGSRRDSILANALEALIGAVLLDGGSEAAGELITRLFAQRLEQLPESRALKDAKTRLQEWLQGRGMALPDYNVQSTAGPPHEQLFTVACTVAEMGVDSVGTGPSRRRAEQDAAAAMLSKLASEAEKTRS